MRPVGVVICNYNKSNYVLDCIQSVLDSKGDLCDIYVVDNASTDGSPERILEKYGDQVTLLQNAENLGGSGGFNTGLRLVLEKGYSYAMCLDDDAMVDEQAIPELYTYLERHPDTGMAGARVYHTQMPEYVQQCGMKIDFAQGMVQTLYADVPEDGTLPEVVECDSVATCAVMVRTEAIRKDHTGIMPEDNFIYWDDTEWGHRMHLAGYRTVTLAAAKALHQMGANTKRPNTFVEYYMWRNRLHFFMKYTPKDQLEQMSVNTLEMIFDAMYTSMLRGAHNKMQTISYAWQDALSGVRGKATEGKILPNDESDEALLSYLRDKHSFCIVVSSNNSGSEEEYTQEAQYLRNFFRSVRPDLEEKGDPKEAEVTICLCSDLYCEKQYDPQMIYIDADRNCIIDDDDRQIAGNYAYSKMLFLYMNQGNFLLAAQREQEKIGN